MAHAAGIDDDDLIATPEAVSCGQVEEIALEVVDDDAPRPGQELADGKKPLAASGASGDEHVPQLTASRGRDDAQEPAEGAKPQKQAGLGFRCVAQKRLELVEMGEAGVLQSRFVACKERGVGQPAQKYAGALHGTGQAQAHSVPSSSRDSSKPVSASRFISSPRPKLRLTVIP